MNSITSNVTVRRKTLRTRISNRIAKSSKAAFVPEDFKDLGGYDQVLRVLRVLRSEDRLIRLGYGIYVKARTSKLSQRVIIDSPAGFAGVAREALNKLGVDWRPTDAEIDYNKGLSTQIPVNPVVNIRGRFSRKISYGDRELVCAR